MADQPLALRSDGDLEAALRAFGEGIAWPEATSTTGVGDVAAAVRARIESSPRTLAAARPRWSWWPARRALVVAVLILLVLAAIAGAATLGLPGLRLILGPAPVSPPPSLAPRASSTAGAAGASVAAGAPGSTMGLGRLTTIRTVVIPGALPAIAVGLRIGLGVAWTAIIAAELAVGAKAGGGGSGGVGQMMFVFYAYSIELNRIVVCMIAVGVVAYALDRALRALLRGLMPWTH